MAYNDWQPERRQFLLKSIYHIILLILKFHQNFIKNTIYLLPYFQLPLNMFAKTILLADDDVDDQEFFLEALSACSSGFNCITVENGQAALDFLNSCAILPHFIFLDINMPVMDGKTCLSQIKKVKRFSEIPVIVCSTANGQETIDEVKKLGAAYYMQKPVKLNEWKQNLVTILSKS
jgi:CheY-like chemotaxis protein